MLVNQAIDSGVDVGEIKKQVDFRSNLKPTEKTVEKKKEEKKENVALKKVEKNEKKETKSPGGNIFKDRIAQEKKDAPKGGGEVHFILRWVNNLLWGSGVEVSNFTEDFADGKVFCALANLHEDCAFDSQESSVENITRSFDVFTSLGIEAILDPQDAGKEKKSMMLYLKLIKDGFKSL